MEPPVIPLDDGFVRGENKGQTLLPLYFSSSLIQQKRDIPPRTHLKRLSYPAKGHRRLAMKPLGQTNLHRISFTHPAKILSAQFHPPKFLLNHLRRPHCHRLPHLPRIMILRRILGHSLLKPVQKVLSPSRHPRLSVCRNSTSSSPVSPPCLAKTPSAQPRCLDGCHALPAADPLATIPAVSVRSSDIAGSCSTRSSPAAHPPQRSPPARDSSACNHTPSANTPPQPRPPR